MKAPSSLSGRWASMKNDLPLFAMLQIPILLLSVVPARALATSHAYPSAPFGYVALLVFRSLPWDLLYLAAVGLLILPTRRLEAPARLRGPILVALYLAFALLGVFHFLAAGLFVRMGGTPTWELLKMAPPLLLHAPKVVSSSDPIVTLSVLAFLWPALLTPALWSAGQGLVRSPREWARATWVLLPGLAALGLVAATVPRDSHRERILRRVSPVNLVRPPATVDRPTELTSRDRQVLEELLGPPRDDGSVALAPLRGQEPNVVVWVLESTGERFLQSHHPFGDIPTPQLDRVAARGSVRFSRAYAECPLSIQSTYTMITGATPPANPSIYKSSRGITPRAPYIGFVLRPAGYHSAFLNTSDLEIWGEPRFLNAAGLDVFEDANTLANRSRYETTDWSYEGRALVERFFSWTDSLPAGEPFLAIVWNVEPHYPHVWVGMPEEVKKADVATRFRAVIEHNDRLLGDLFDGLVERNLDEDTLLVVVGDHGQGLGRGGRPYDRFESLLVSEDATQVPLVFIHPALPRGVTVVDIPATLADLYPTLLDLLGIPVPEGTDGASLAREYQPRVGVSRAMTWWPLTARAGRYKLVLDSANDPPELYDLEADPWETRDISARHEEVTRALWAWLETTTARLREEDPSFELF